MSAKIFLKFFLFYISLKRAFKLRMCAQENIRPPIRPTTKKAEGASPEKILPLPPKKKFYDCYLVRFVMCLSYSIIYLLG